MRWLISVVLVLAVVGLSAQEMPKNALPEVQQLKAQVFALKVQVAQLEASRAELANKLAGYELTKEQTTLAAEFLKVSKAPEGSTWDWSKMAPNVPKAAEKK